MMMLQAFSILSMFPIIIFGILGLSTIPTSNVGISALILIISMCYVYYTQGHFIGEYYRLRFKMKAYLMGNKTIVTCKYCGRAEYWGQLRWYNGKCSCRACYKSDWEDRTGKVYT